MIRYFITFLNICLLIFGLYGLYHAVICINLFRQQRKRPKPCSKKINRFAVIICAYNEEPVIATLLRSLKNQDYPADAYDIHVIADNCTDQTAEIAEREGAHVWKRYDPIRRSKGFALNWFFRQFNDKWREQYDACAIFDADNLVDPHYLSVMNRELNLGNPIVVGYRMGKNPSSSWVAGCCTLFWLMQSRCFLHPRNSIGLPCLSVGGTGFVFDFKVLSSENWKTQSVCEDIEFTFNSIAKGYYVAYAPDAIFYDEQPLLFWQSIKQRYRWSLGSLQCLTFSVPRLINAAQRGSSKVWDAILFSFGVPFTGISAIAWTALVVAKFIEAGSLINRNLMAMIGGAMLIGYVSVVLLAVLVLIMEKKRWPGDWKAVLTFPIFIFSWSIITAVVLFYRNTTWQKMDHNENIELDDLNIRGV